MKQGVSTSPNSLHAGYRRALRNAGVGGAASEWLYKFIGAAIAAVAMRRGIHPSVLSLCNVACAAVAAVPIILFSEEAAPFWYPGLGAVLLWMSAYSFDCADGQLARTTGKTSEFGGRVDVLADYSAQLLVAMSVATVALRFSMVPDFVVVSVSGLWLASLFTAALRASDVTQGHALIQRRRVSFALKSLIDTGLVYMVVGSWLFVSPATVIVPVAFFMVMNLGLLIASIARETQMSVHTCMHN